MDERERNKQPFWQRKTLSELTPAEWESLCDGCGKCCTYKLEDHDTGELFQTEVCCKLLDTHACQCSNYPQRKRYVSDCVQLTPDNVLGFNWLPESCGYVRVAKGLPLPEWHHLLTGDRESIHRAGASVRDQVISEERAGDLEEHIIARFK